MFMNLEILRSCQEFIPEDCTEANIVDQKMGENPELSMDLLLINLEVLKGMNSCVELEERDQNKFDSLICDTLKAIQDIQSFLCKSSEPRSTVTPPKIQAFSSLESTGIGSSTFATS